MNEDLRSERDDVLRAIDRRREETSLEFPARGELEPASPSALRALASSIRSAAWTDRSMSAEELADFVQDPGWAPSAAVRVAALIDHLSELSRPNGTDLTCKALPRPVGTTAPAIANARWNRISLSELVEKLKSLETNTDVLVFDPKGTLLVRSNSWTGQIIELVDLAAPAERQEQDKKNKDVKERATMWADALVRAGYLRGHFGPTLTAHFFRRYVVGGRRIDVAVDLNAIINGLVHHVARMAPHVDFSRSAITDLEIQRLHDAKKAETWRKACRCLEHLPVKGPAWRSLGRPDTTALLVARAEQRGSKAPGADALLGHDFEESLGRSHGISSVLLCSDVALARTLAARLRPGCVWAAYVDAPTEDERFLSPMLSWPRGNASEARYSSLAALLDEILVANLAEQLFVTDGAISIELRGYIAGEHQYVSDWRESLIYMRGFGQPAVRATRSLRWPLRSLSSPGDLIPSGARVTIEQAAVALEWVRASGGGQLSREQLPLSGDARNEAWTFLKAIGVLDAGGKPIAHSTLLNAALHRDMEEIRSLVLRFEPIAKIMEAIHKGARTPSDIETETDLGKRTFGAAINLAISCGLIWRILDRVGNGSAFVSQDTFMEWLLKATPEPVRVSALAERAATELELAPARFQEALEIVQGDPRLDGKRGGSAESSHLDCKSLVIDESGRIIVRELQADDILQLRTLQTR